MLTQVDVHSRSHAPVQSFLALLTFQLVILCLGGCPLRYIMLIRSISGLYPLHALTSLSPPAVIIRIISRHYQMWGGEEGSTTLV